MASEKSKASGKNAAYDRLRKAIKEKAPARAYLFYGEESYLRQTYVQQLQELLIPRGSEDFNFHRLSRQPCHNPGRGRCRGVHAHDGAQHPGNSDGLGYLQAR